MNNIIILREFTLEDIDAFFEFGSNKIVNKSGFYDTEDAKKYNWYEIENLNEK